MRRRRRPPCCSCCSKGVLSRPTRWARRKTPREQGGVEIESVGLSQEILVSERRGRGRQREREGETRAFAGFAKRFTLSRPYIEIWAFKVPRECMVRQAGLLDLHTMSLLPLCCRRAANDGTNFHTHNSPSHPRSSPVCLIAVAPVHGTVPSGGDGRCGGSVSEEPEGAGCRPGGRQEAEAAVVRCPRRLREALARGGERELDWIESKTSFPS